MQNLINYALIYRAMSAVTCHLETVLRHCGTRIEKKAKECLVFKRAAFYPESLYNSINTKIIPHVHLLRMPVKSSPAGGMFHPVAPDGFPAGPSDSKEAPSLCGIVFLQVRALTRD